MSDEILEVDLLAFETGDADARKAVVDGLMRSLATGFVYVTHDVSADLIDTAYARLEQFFSLPAEEKARFVAPGTHGQTGYTGLLVETAATADVADWKEMLNWARDIDPGHPLRTRFPHRYHPQVLPEAAVPGISEVLNTFNDAIFDLQRRILRIIATGIGCHESYFEKMLVDGSTLSRAIHYPDMGSAPDAPHVWAGEHADINLITALPRATAPGLQVKLKDTGDWVDAVAGPDQAIINTGLMLEVITNGVIAPGVHRVVAAPDQPGDRYSVVQFCHPTPWTILAPVASCVTAQHPQRFAPIAAADALDLVLYEINLIEDARS
ncbi:isopenicillin N synthase family oxygenase [Aquihabitans sp. G128]|uniref:isopenicillin N synthase family dioxygenase n=1 Tax=Aquihabitans sp. G128 TaxID=2849779 RepID=UPI001C22610C|nr:2-oxoglutarate and iron-dependent oxygenase domain-containing protein [Aquihabitans sp. G128]QXC63309.1 isopenicillin N synthase family oxygenase [Aquihabitans sp. G128]